MQSRVVQWHLLRRLLLPVVILATLFVASGTLLLAQIREFYPQVNFQARQEGSGGVLAFSSQDEPVIELSSWELRGPVELVLYKTNKEFLLQYLTHTSANKQIMESVDTSGMTEVARFSQDISNTAAKVLLPLDPSGIWYLEMRGPSESKNDAVILRGSYGGVVKSTGDSFVVWTQDFVSQRSISQVQTTLYDLTDTQTQLGSGVTAENGVIQLPYSTKADIALIEKDGQVALIPINLKYFNDGYTYARFAPMVSENKYYLFSDRPLYKPGDTIYFKGIIRSDDDGRYSVPNATTARVKLYREWNEEDVVFEKLLAVSQDGSVAGEFALPESFATGSYTLDISATDDEDPYWQSSRQVYIQVEEYRKPEYTISLQSSAMEAVIGQPQSVTVQGMYFSGQPLVGGAVEYRIDASDLSYIQTAASVIRMQESNDLYGGYWWGGSEIASGVLNLNGAGTAEIELPLDPENTTGQLRVYTISVEYMDESANPVIDRKNILVYPADWGIFRKDAGWKSGKIGQEYELPLQVTQITANTESTSGVALTAQVTRETWVKLGSGDSVRYEQEKEALPEQTVITNRSGEATVSFTPTREGYYTIVVTGYDSKKRKILNTFYAWISTESNTWLQGTYPEMISIRADKEVYEPGETAVLTISSEVPDRDVLLTVQRGRVDRFQMVRMTGGTAQVRLPLLDADMPNTYARVHSFGRDVLDVSSTKLTVSAERKRISVSLTPDRTYYGPGDTVSLEVQTTNYLDQPLSAEVAVWTVDKAIYELTSDKRKNIFEAFWSERYESAQTGHSLENINFYMAEGGGGCFVAGTTVLMADGTEQAIETVRVGDKVLTRVSETDPTLVAAAVTDTHTTEEGGYLIINGMLKVTPNHILWVNDTWKTASEVQVGDRMVDTQGEALEVTSLEWFAQKVSVYNLTVEKYHTYFADGLWVHNQKGDTRSVLKDVAYWNPSVRTDASGKATITFKLPDNLTAWIISGVAATQATDVGESKVEVVTQKDVVVRPILPNILRVGDQLKISALVNNFTEDELEILPTLEFPAVEITKAIQDPVRVAAKGGREQIYWSIKPQTVDKNAVATFTAKATGVDEGDSIAQPIPVVPYGFMEQHSYAGVNNTEFTLAIPADADPAYSTLQLQLSPTMLGTLPAAMQYLLEYPYGCVEQTTSRFVPALLAKTNPTIFGTEFAGLEIDELLEQGIVRLQALQNGDGGWGWTSSGVSDPFITAYVAEYLARAKEAGVVVDEATEWSLKSYVEGQNTSLEEAILRAYAKHRYFGESESVLLPVTSLESTELVAYALMVNVENGFADPRENGYDMLVSRMQQDGELAYYASGKQGWFGSRDATTALAVRALITAGAEETTTSPLVRYLLEKRQKKFWSNTFSTAQVIDAVLAYARSYGDISPNLSYKVYLNSEIIGAGSVDSATKVIPPVTIPADTKSGVVRVEAQGAGNLYSTLAIDAFRTDDSLDAVNNGIVIKRDYITGSGREYYPVVGDTVTVRLTVSGIPNSTEYLVIEDTLPAGMIPINSKLANEKFGMDSFFYGGYWSNPDERTKKDGAVFLLNNLERGRQTVTYQARVVAPGEFRVPPAFVSDMYNTEVYGYTDAIRVKVTETLQRDPAKVVSGIVEGVLSIPEWIRAHTRELVGAICLLVGVVITTRLAKKQKQKSQQQAQDSDTGVVVEQTQQPVVQDQAPKQDQQP